MMRRCGRPSARRPLAWRDPELRRQRRLRALHGPLEPRRRARLPRVGGTTSGRALARRGLRHRRFYRAGARYVLARDGLRRRPARGADRSRMPPAGGRASEFPGGRCTGAALSPMHTFDVVASALVINFIPDRPRALSEMRRVARPGGIVAGYVWDFAAEAPRAGRCAAGCAGSALRFRNAGHRRIRASTRSFAVRAGRPESIATRTIEVLPRYSDFDDFWQAQTPSYSPPPG